MIIKFITIHFPTPLKITKDFVTNVIPTNII